jgi:hypothetical protein
VALGGEVDDGIGLELVKCLGNRPVVDDVRLDKTMIRRLGTAARASRRPA